MRAEVVDPEGVAPLAKTVSVKKCPALIVGCLVETGVSVLLVKAVDLYSFQILAGGSIYVYRKLLFNGVVEHGETACAKICVFA